VPLPICATCGVQYDDAHRAGERCRICEDERQYVGWSGQQWTTLEELAASGRHGDVRREGDGPWGVGIEPAVGIGQRALLVPGDGGNVMWDCVGYIDDGLVAAVAERGGVAAIAISHPHFYGVAVEWSAAFGDAPIYIHAADREWWPRDGNVVFWDGDTREILPGRVLVNCGVHFAGGQVLWARDDGAGRPAVFSGDIFTVVMDRRWVSFMYSYPNLIPESPEVIERAVRLVEPYDFDVIYGAWWGRVVTRDAKAALRRSADRYLRRIGYRR
jgi:glyoxylase-like metal-dependent hydrolase (beta-lactamase superfamily II)